MKKIKGHFWSPSHPSNPSHPSIKLGLSPSFCRCWAGPRRESVRNRATFNSLQLLQKESPIHPIPSNYKWNPFIKVHQKIEIAFKFTWKILYKLIGPRKKINSEFPSNLIWDSLKFCINWSDPEKKL